MYKNSKGQIIGKGEDTVKKLLNLFFGHYNVKAQVSIRDLVDKETYEFYDEIYKKATADFTLRHKNTIYAVRVQGTDHASGKKGISHQDKSRKDKIQKQDMERNGVRVIDILFRECPNIFKERYNWDSIIEFCNMMKMGGLKL